MKIFWSDLKKIIFNSWFLIAPLMVFFLCFTSNVYTDSDTGKVYTVFEAIFCFDRTFKLESNSFASINVLRIVFSGYITMFMPIVAALPFMLSFCTERNSGFMRFQITRSGKMKYYISKYFVALVSGGIAVLIGIIMFAIAAGVLFPAISEYDLTGDDHMEVLYGGIFFAYVRIFVTAFLYGAISALLAFVISSFSRNPYLITCLPFMLDYIRDTVLNRKVSEELEKGDYSLVLKYQPFTSGAITSMINTTRIDKRVEVTLIFSVIYVTVGFILFCFLMNKRTDQGV